MNKLKLRVMEGEYAVWQMKIEEGPAVSFEKRDFRFVDAGDSPGEEPVEYVPEVGDEIDLWVMVRTKDEISMVAREGLVPAGAKAEKGWRCIGVEGPIAFEEVGVLASLTGALARAGVSVFAVSTYDTDYVLVKDAQLETARRALEGAGHAFIAE